MWPRVDNQPPLYVAYQGQGNGGYDRTTSWELIVSTLDTNVARVFTGFYDRTLEGTMKGGHFKFRTTIVPLVLIV